MTEFDDLVAIMARLRADDGCPWDREQTHESLRPYLMEEAYEVLEAVDSGDPQKLCGELGDLLLQIVFHAQIAAENGEFGIADVCHRISHKLRHRHPHVFGDVTVRDSGEVVDNWERLKRQEAEHAPRTSVLDGVPTALPSLRRAAELQKRAARVGFDWPDVDGPLQKVSEELHELAQARCAADPEAVQRELGDLLFAVVNVSRFLAVDAEDALRLACQRFSQRFRQIEEAVANSGQDMTAMPLADLDRLWEAAKKAD